MFKYFLLYIEKNKILYLIKLKHHKLIYEISRIPSKYDTYWIRVCIPVSSEIGNACNKIVPVFIKMSFDIKIDKTMTAVENISGV